MQSGVNHKLNPHKTKICQTSVNYVGHIITAGGMKSNPDRIQAILDLPSPTDIAAVQRFLGMIGYVSKFTPNMAEITKPLQTVIQKDIAWHWEEPQINAFKQLKELLSKAPIL